MSFESPLFKNNWYFVLDIEKSAAQKIEEEE
jgi:hypothetical protein